MKYLILPLLALTVGCSTTEQYAMYDAEIASTQIVQAVTLPDYHPRSVIGQDPITWDEVQMCDDLRYQADYGPLSNRVNNTGSIGTCSPKSGSCVIYWIDTDLCDVIEKHEPPVKRASTEPPKSRLQQLQDAVDHCYSGAPKFGPQPPCEMLEDMYWDELQKER